MEAFITDCKIAATFKQLQKYFYNRGRYPALGHPVPGAISFFLNEKKINIFCLIALFSSDLLNPNFVEKKIIFHLFFLESYFSDEQSKFLDFRFY